MLAILKGVSLEEGLHESYLTAGTIDLSGLILSADLLYEFSEGDSTSILHVWRRH